MKICAINGSPRKRGNTARLLSWALDGVKNAREDAETELINLSMTSASRAAAAVFPASA